MGQDFTSMMGSAYGGGYPPQSYPPTPQSTLTQQQPQPWPPRDMKYMKSPTEAPTKNPANTGPIEYYGGDGQGQRKLPVPSPPQYGSDEYESHMPTWAPTTGGTNMVTMDKNFPKPNQMGGGAAGFWNPLVSATKMVPKAEYLPKPNQMGEGGLPMGLPQRMPPRTAQPPQFMPPGGASMGSSMGGGADSGWGARKRSIRDRWRGNRGREFYGGPTRPPQKDEFPVKQSPAEPVKTTTPPDAAPKPVGPTKNNIGNW